MGKAPTKVTLRKYFNIQTRDCKGGVLAARVSGLRVAIQCISRQGVMCTWAMLREPSPSLLGKAWSRHRT